MADYAFQQAKDQKVCLDMMVMAIKKDDVQLFNFACESSHPSGSSLTVHDSMIMHFTVSQSSMQQALHLAAEYGRQKFVKRLVEEFKCDVNVRCGLTGYTPLMFAVQRMDNEMVKYLLEHGADMKPVSICGRDALKIAVDNDEHQMIEYLKHYHDKKKTMQDNFLSNLF